MKKKNKGKNSNSKIRASTVVLSVTESSRSVYWKKKKINAVYLAFYLVKQQMGSCDSRNLMKSTLQSINVKTRDYKKFWIVRLTLNKPGSSQDSWTVLLMKNSNIAHCSSLVDVWAYNITHQLDTQKYDPMKETSLDLTWCCAVLY